MALTLTNVQPIDTSLLGSSTAITFTASSDLDDAVGVQVSVYVVALDTEEVVWDGEQFVGRYVTLSTKTGNDFSVRRRGGWPSGGAALRVREMGALSTMSLLTSYLTPALASLLGTSDGQIVALAGHTTAGDGGQGLVRWVLGSSVTADGGTVFGTTSGAGSGRWKREYDGAIDTRWFGAPADGATASGPAVRLAATAASGTTGGELKIPHGTTVVNASGGSCIALTLPTSIEGSGGVYAAINPSGAASTDHTISVTPNPSYDLSLMRFEGFSLHNPSTGQRAGKHGIYLDTQVAAAYLPKFTVRDVQFGTPSHADGFSIYHENNIVNNVNGGMYLATFENCVMKGGIRLSGSGDSINILHNVMSGTNIGVYASIKADASCLQIVCNNITTSNGAIRIGSGHRFRILGNNIENYSAAGAAANNNAAVINIAGDVGEVFGGVIKENLISAYADTDATCCLRLANCRGTLVEDNVFLSGGGAGDPTVAIVIESTAIDCRIGGNSFNAALRAGGVAAGEPNITDNGVGTMGIRKAGTLQNSWVVRSASHHGFDYIKSLDGVVHISGSCKEGTITTGTQIMTMPLGFRPTTIIRAPMTYFDNGTGTHKSCEITVETGGEVRVNGVLDATTYGINFDFTYGALSAAHSVTTE